MIFQLIALYRHSQKLRADFSFTFDKAFGCFAKNLNKIEKTYQFEMNRKNVEIKSRFPKSKIAILKKRKEKLKIESKKLQGCSTLKRPTPQ